MPNTSISFPASPTVNQQYTYGTTTYVWTGTEWMTYINSANLMPTNPAAMNRQMFSGTGSQTVFTLASDPGALGNGTVIYINGVYQQKNTYTTSGTTLTFTEAPPAGTNNIEVVNFVLTNVTTTSSDFVNYVPAGAGAVARTGTQKFAETISVKDFGAVGDGVADDTVALKAAFDYAIPLARPVVLQGTYRITGPLQTGVTRTSGELHIICDGDVKINVDPASAAFYYVMFIQRSTVTSVSITGGSLAVDCANKAAYAFYLRHLDTVEGGTCTLDLPTTILNVKQNVSSADAAGVSVYGLFRRIEINDTTVIGVERVGAGVCRGIEVGLFQGEVTIRRPYIKNVLFPASSTSDADGIAVAGYYNASSGLHANLDSRPGRVVIESPTFIDCQGRAFKAQCSNCTLVTPYVFRKNYVGYTSGHDFDFQFGGGTVISPVFEYRLNSGTSPLGVGFAPIAFQNRMQDKELSASVTNARLVTDVDMQRFAISLYSTTAKSSTVTIDGLDILPSSSIATAVITRSLCEVSNIDFLATMPGTATIVVKNIRGPLDASGIGYTGYTGTSVASKLRISVTNIHNTISPGAFSNAFHAISGSKITALDSFVVHNNHNMRNAVYTFSSGVVEGFDFANLAVGNVFGIDLSAIGTITNAPPWQTGSGGYAIVEVLQGIGPSTITKALRVTTFGTSSRNQPKVWMSVDNATSWQEVGSNVVITKTADFTVAAHENVLVNNKSGSACVVTLPAAASYNGRRIVIKTIQAQAVNSASSNVVPLVGGAAGTAILAATAGKYAELVSDGTNWIIMSAN